MTNAYEEAYRRSIEDPEGFWGEAAEAITWTKKWDKVLDDSNKPFYRWFAGGALNTCYNALDVHIENGRGDQPALIYDSPVTDTIKTYTYTELRDEVAKVRWSPQRAGGGKGRPCPDLHAHDCRSRHGHAGLCPHRGRAFRRVRWICRQ
jgi:propionyl-CoA synthetase